MTRQQVEINFDEAKRQVRVIEEGVEILRKADRIHNEMQENTASGWKGINADHFQSISRDLGQKMAIRANNIEEIAVWTRHRAQVLYDTEMEAIRIAEERAYQEQQARAAEAARQAEAARAAEQSRQEAQARAAAEQTARNAAEALRRIFR